MEYAERELILNQVLSDWYDDGAPELTENFETQIELPNGNRMFAIINPNNPGYYQIISPDNDEFVKFDEPNRWRYVTTKINTNSRRS